MLFVIGLIVGLVVGAIGGMILASMWAISYANDSHLERG